jgi:ferredoxin-NADP reductase
MLLEFQKAIVTKIVDETYNTKRFFLQIQNTENFDFLPGQFITMDLPIHEKKAKRLRSYSIASAPNGTNEIELVIVLLPGGLGTEYLFHQISIGSTIDLRGALGHFTIPEIVPEDLFLICTGTGIAPFRSMVHFIHNNHVAHKNIYLISGVRTQKDLLYHTEMMELSTQLQGFQYLPTLSREEWIGANGYVHALYEAHCANKPHAEFMLCGWRAMIDEAREKLAGLGYDKKQIHFELYG